MSGIKIPQQEFALKMQGGLMREGGVYLRDTTVTILPVLIKVTRTSPASN